MSFFTSSTKPAFVAIGDIVIDAFIKIKNAHEVPDPTTGASELCMPFADKIPFEFSEECVAVGNSANAAVSAARLGLTSALVTNVGDDQHAKECLTQLKKDHVGTQFVMGHKGMKTNYHYVLWFKQDRTILIKHENFPLVLPNVGSPTYLYLSSLGENSLAFHSTIADYLDTHPTTKLVFQPGTFQIKFGTTALSRLYKHSTLFFCNLEEAEHILGIQNRDIQTLLSGLKALGPELPVITDGPKGSYTLIDGHAVFMPAYPDQKAPYERTGAGDAFASTFTIALALGQTTETALRWASANSMNVCQYVGAQKGLLTRLELEDLVERAPTDWKLHAV